MPAASRSLLALHVACAFPLVALWVWFGSIDRLPFGEGRCASCGVEGYVVAAHVVAALWLGVVAVRADVARREIREGISVPGRRMIAALCAVGVFVTASVIWHPLFDWPALITMITVPAAGIWWFVSASAWFRQPAATDEELNDRLRKERLAAWVSLTLLLPATYAWIWSDRVAWLVF